MDGDDLISADTGTAGLKHVLEFLDTKSLHEMKRPSKRFKDCAESVLNERLPNANYDQNIYLQLITNNSNSNNNDINLNNNSSNDDDDSDRYWLTGGLYAGNATVKVTNPSLYNNEDLKPYYLWRIKRRVDDTAASSFDVVEEPMIEEVEAGLEGEEMMMMMMEGQRKGGGSSRNIKYGDIIYLQKVNINDFSENKWLKGGEGSNQESVNTLDIDGTTTNHNSDGCGYGADSYQWKIRSCTPFIIPSSSFNNNDTMDIDPKHGRNVKYNDPICLQMINNHQNRWLCGNSMDGCVNSIPFDGEQQQQQYYNDNSNNNTNPFDDDTSPMLSFRFRIRNEFVL